MSNTENTISVKYYYRQITETDIGGVARELLGYRVKKETSTRLECDCPHHKSKTGLSLHVRLDNQSWYCFGCGVGGDVLQFVEFVQSGVVTKGESGSMPESHRRARDYLAEKVGLPPLSGGGFSKDQVQAAEALRAETESVQIALTEIARFYNARLWANPEVLAWVQETYGFSDETIERLLIGYADNGPGLDAESDPCESVLDALLRSPGVQDEPTLIMTSAFRSVEGRGTVPFFEKRIVFPYWSRGHVVFMIGRKTPWTPSKPWEDAKYKKLAVRTKERDYVASCIHNGYIYNEDCLLERPDRVVITEGVTDCIAAMQVGIPCISPVTVRFRKADTERLLGLVRRTKQVVICNDSEESGVGAAGALQTAGALFNAGVDVRIASIPRPDGSPKVDINEYIKTREMVDGPGTGAAAFERVVDRAVPYVEYLIDCIPNDTPKADLMERLDRILATVSSINPILQKHYIDMVADRLQVSKQGLNRRLKEVQKNLRGKQTSDADNAEDNAENNAEGLPIIITSGRQLREQRHQIMKVLSDSNRRLLEKAAGSGLEPADLPIVFSRADKPVRLTNNTGTALISSIDNDLMYTIITELADWCKETEVGFIATKPDTNIARGLVSLPPYGLPILEHLIGTPVFDSDGELMTRPGYHEKERTWLQVAKGLELPEVPQEPSKKDLERAKSLIFNDLFVDFPFVSQADRANTLAAFLLPFLRKMVGGTTPLHLIEAPEEGTGKGKICNLISIVATGAGAFAQTLPSNPEETRKTLTAELAAGRQIVLLDNADDKRVLHNNVLASILTSENWTDRLLGKSVKVALANHAAWFLTGNNPRLTGELARRCVRIRLVSNRENPSDRDDFKHNPIEEWAHRNRPELVWAALTLIQAWIAAGRPPGNQIMGSFESWARTISGVLDVIEFNGFLDNRKEFLSEANDDTEMWREFTRAWWNAFGEEPQRVKELNELCEQHDLMSDRRGNESTSSQQKRLGNAIRSAKDRTYGGFQIRKSGMKRGRHGYCLVKVDGENGEQSKNREENGDQQPLKFCDIGGQSKEADMDEEDWW